MGILKGEGRRSLLMFSYIFLVIASLLIIKPVRNSLFLTEFGPEKLPFAFILTAIVSTFTALLYSRLSGKFPLKRLILYSLTFTIVSLIIIWILLGQDHRSILFVYGFYIWTALFGVIAASQFWLLANYVFNAREAKRLFGFLGAGGIAGAIFGGYLTNYLTPHIGSANLVLLCAIFLAVCMVIIDRIWKKHLRHKKTGFEVSRRSASAHSQIIEPVKMVLQSRHLSCFAGIIGIGVVVANLVDYQFNTIASEQISDGDELTAFFGLWFSNLSVISLIIQLFFTGKILRKLGVGNSLYFLPAGIFVSALTILFSPVIWTAILIKVSDGAFKQSVHKSGLELMMLPVPPAIKNKVKVFIDVFVDNLGMGLGGALLVILTMSLHSSVRGVSIAILVLISLWVLMIRFSKKEYLESFRSAIEKRNIDLKDLSINFNDASVGHIIEKVLNSDNERQIVYILELLEGVSYDAAISYFDKLIKHPSAEVRAWVLRLTTGNKDFDYLKEAGELMSHENPDVRVQAILYISRLSESPFLTLEALVNTWDIGIKSAAIITAAREFQRAPDLFGEKEFLTLFNEAFNVDDSIKTCAEERLILKIHTAEVIGIAKIPELYVYLFRLLEDDSIEVRIAAITGAGKIQAPEFIPYLSKMLEDRHVRIYARKALSQFGETVVEDLTEKMRSEDLSKNTKIEIVKTLGLIDSVKAFKWLLKSIDFDELDLRLEMIKALNKQHERYPDLKLDRRFILKYIRKELTYFYEFVVILNSHRKNFANLKLKSSKKKEKPLKKSFFLLEKAIDERLHTSLIRIFRLLGLIYPQGDIYSAYLAVTSDKPELHANTIEFLDTLLDQELKNGIIPLIERNTAEEIIPLIPDDYKSKLRLDVDYKKRLIESGDTGLIIYTLYYIANTDETVWKEQVLKLIDSKVNIIKETANYTLHKLDYSN